MNALAELLSVLRCDRSVLSMDPEFILAEMEVGTIMRPNNIVWAHIDCNGKFAHLPTGYSWEELRDFLTELGTMEYDNGFGFQQLGGVVALTKGEWLSRGEYDGSEWWDWNVYPKEENYVEFDPYDDPAM